MNNLLTTLVCFSVIALVQSQFWRLNIQDAIQLEQRDRGLSREKVAISRDIARKKDRIEELQGDINRDRQQLRRLYDRDGYDQRGYGRDGYNRIGYNEYGHGRDGYDRDGYDRSGYHRNGYNRNDYGRHLYDQGGSYGGGRRNRH